MEEQIRILNRRRHIAKRSIGLKEEILWLNKNYVLNACSISIWLLNANLEIA
jgi:hypothetical protein